MISFRFTVFIQLQLIYDEIDFISEKEVFCRKRDILMEYP